MKNKTLIGIFAIVLVISMLFLGAYITGWVVQKVDYNDLCKTDSDCSNNQCCLISQYNKSLGVCMDACQSFEFLCRSNEQCENGTVCCISEGMEYGLCNYNGMCKSTELFADYTRKTAEIEQINGKPAPIASLDLKIIIIAETVIIAALILFILWLLTKSKKNKRL